MSRRHQRDPVPVVLTLPAEPPTEAEIDAILLGADSIAFDSGRTTLTLVLAGSRNKRVLERGLDEVEAYGALSHLAQETIGMKVDWCIHHGWLRLKYDYGLPMIYPTDKGSARSFPVWVNVIFEHFTAWAAANEPQRVWPYIESIHRDIKFQLLDKIAAEHRRDHVPVLRAWFPHETRKHRIAINHALERLGVPGLRHPSD